MFYIKDTGCNNSYIFLRYLSTKDFFFQNRKFTFSQYLVKKDYLTLKQCRETIEAFVDYKTSQNNKHEKKNLRIYYAKL